MARALSYPITRPISRAVSGVDLGKAGVPPVNLGAPTAKAAPTDSGLAYVSVGSWSPTPTSFSVQVKRNGVAVGSPITTPYKYVPVQYTFVTADVGATMTADVTALNGGAPSAVQTVALGTPTFKGVFGSSLFAGLASWTAGASTITANAATAPDGTSTAYQVLATATTSGHNISIASQAKAAALTYYRLQVWAKPVNGYNIAIRLDDGTSTNVASWTFDINTGVIKTAGVAGSGLVATNARITAAANGFYRCEATFRVESTITTIREILALADASFNSASFLGNASNGVLLWSPQSVVAVTPASAAIGATPQIILNTAMCTDDSFDALYYLCKSADIAACNILAVTANNSVATSASCIKAMLNFSGYSSVPVGAYQGNDRETNDNYTALVTTRFRPGDSRANYSSSLSVIRQQLAAAADGAVTIMVAANLGDMQDLLNSPADGFSSLAGMDLVAKKVGRLVMMAGDFLTGAEHNFQVLPAASAFVMANWPTEIVQTGFAMGANIFCRPPLGYDPLTNPYGYAFDNLGQSYQSQTGVTNLAITAPGSGGTNGTFALSATGVTDFAGIFTVAGGVVTSVKVTNAGSGASSPTIGTSASAGLTGATITPTTSAYNTRSGWDGASAMIAVNGISSTSFSWVAALGLTVVNSGTGNNTFGMLEPNNGLQEYLTNKATLGAIASLVNQRVAA